MKHLSIVCLGLVLAVVTTGAQKQRYGVTVTADRKADFGAFKSYTWDTAGYPAMDKAVHQQIVDAVDRELKGLGLEKRTSEPADVVVLYGAQRRTDTDTHADAPATNIPVIPPASAVRMSAPTLPGSCTSIATSRSAFETEHRSAAEAGRREAMATSPDGVRTGLIAAKTAAGTCTTSTPAFSSMCARRASSVSAAIRDDETAAISIT